MTGCGHEATIQAQAEQIAALEADIRQMVEKAADNSLEGYRELGRRAAEAENERDTLKAEVERLTEKLESREATMASMKVEAQPAFIRLRSQLSEYELEVSRLVKMLGGTKTLATELMRQEMELNSLRTRLALADRVVVAAKNTITEYEKYPIRTMLVNTSIPWFMRLLREALAAWAQGKEASGG